MDRLTDFRDLIKRILLERADLLNSQPVPGLETLCVFDEASDVYMVLNVGWLDRRRVQYFTLLVRILDCKIWIEEDGTEEGLANSLVAAGIPAQNIVVAYNPPELRKMTEYAVA